MSTTPTTSFLIAAIRTASLLAPVAGANAAPVLIDFSNATPAPAVADGNGNRWTTVGAVGLSGPAANTSVSNLIDATGVATTLDIELTLVGVNLVGYGGNGINGPAGPAPFDQSFAVIDGIYSNSAAGIATVTFSGLAPVTPYNLSMIGGRVSNGFDGRILVITGTGSGGLLLNDGTVLDLTIVSDDSGEIAFTYADAATTPSTAAASLNAMSITQGTKPGFPLVITPATAPATGFDLEWESQAGKLYNLRTSTDLVGTVGSWELVAGNIVATPPANLFNVPPAGPKRFYAVEEFDVPPLLSEDFEENGGGFTVATGQGTDWAHGTPDSSGSGGTVNSANGGQGKAWGTNLGSSSSAGGSPTPVESGFYASPTRTALRSPVIDLTGVAGAVLTFAEALDFPAADTAVVNLINATTDDVIARIHTSTDVDVVKALWKGVGPIDLAAGAGQKVRIEWRLEGVAAPSFDFMGWYVDDVLVETTP